MLFKVLIDTLTDVRRHGVSLEALPEFFWDPAWGEPFFLSLIKFDWSAIIHMPQDLINYEMCVEAVRQNVGALQYVPYHLLNDDLLNEEIYHLLAEQHVTVLQHIPPIFLNREICMAAVKADGVQLRHVPLNLIDVEMCIEGILSDWNALEYVPTELRIEVVKRFPDSDIINHIPINWRSEDLMIAYATEHDSCLSEIPSHLKTYTFCKKMVELGKYDVITDVPQEYLDLEIYELASRTMMADAKQLNLIPDEFRTQSICLNHVRNDGNSIKFVPSNLRNDELLILASETDDLDLRLSDIDVKSALVIVNQNGLHLKGIPLSSMTEEVCIAAFKQNEAVAYEIPVVMQNREICQMILGAKNFDFHKMSDSFKSQLLCDMAVEKNYENLKYVPIRCWNEKMTEFAVRSKGRYLRYVPENYKTLEICELAVQNSAKAWRFVPEALLDKLNDETISAPKESTSVIEQLPIVSLPDEIESPRYAEQLIESLPSGCPEETISAINNTFGLDSNVQIHSTRTNGGDIRVRVLNISRPRNVFTMYWQVKKELFHCRILLNPNEVNGPGIVDAKDSYANEPLPTTFGFDCSSGEGAIPNLIKLINRAISNAQ
jgi:hypothetical protein